MNKPKFDKTWTLFLDRDGVINRRLPGKYVTNTDTFTYLPGSLEAIVFLNKIFGRTFVVTNQKGVGKGLMTRTDLDLVHDKLSLDLQKKGGQIDQFFAATDALLTPTSRHKPNPGMALEAQVLFPEIDFQKSVIVGDSISDMTFGRDLRMWTVLVAGKAEEREAAELINVHQRVPSLKFWADSLKRSAT